MPDWPYILLVLIVDMYVILNKSFPLFNCDTSSVGKHVVLHFFENCNTVARQDDLL